MKHNDQNNLTGIVLLIAGSIELVAGLAHFVMPYFAFQAHGFTSLNQAESDFVTLSVFAVGILLIAFGVVTILFSFRTVDEMIMPYVLIQAILWLARIVFEVLYPVKIGLFWIGQPTKVIMPLLILECALFAVSVLLIAINRKSAGSAMCG